MKTVRSRALPNSVETVFTTPMEKVNLTSLTGKIGITDTNLSPAGTVLIDEEIYEAKTDGEFIEEGRGVRVIRVRGKKIIVIRV